MKKKIGISICLLIIIFSITFILIRMTEKKEEVHPNEIVVEEKEKEEIVIDNKAKVKMSPDVDFNVQRSKYGNNEIVGRLEIPGLFNILVVRGNDNSYYLKHSIYRKSDYKGSEFVDYRNIDLTANQVNIYGHNSRENMEIPFKKLENYLNKQFFDENPFIVFQFDGGRRVFKIMSIKEVTTDYEHMTLGVTGEEFVRHIDKLKANSIFTRDIKYDENSNIIVLQTCSHHLDNAYYVITGIEVEYTAIPLN